MTVESKDEFSILFLVRWIFLFATTTRLVLGSTQAPIQFVPKALCQMAVVWQQKHEADPSLPSSD